MNGIHEDTTVQPDEEVDIAIVGGGIAGLYCLHRLLSHNDHKNKKIKLYESCDHLGGRIETWSLKRVQDNDNGWGYVVAADPRHALKPDYDSENDPYDKTGKTEYFRAEFGPMRIEPRDQHLLKQLLDELDIKEPVPSAAESFDDLIPFFSYASEDPQSPKFTLKGEEGQQGSPIDLLLLGIWRILEVIDNPSNFDTNWRNNEAKAAWENIRSAKSFYRRYWKGYLLEWINRLQDTEDGENSDYLLIRQEFAINGHALWDYGFWNLMSDVLSHYAVVKIRDWGTYYHFLHENLNAAEWLVFWLKAIKGTSALRGVRGGMSRIIYKLLVLLKITYENRGKTTCNLKEMCQDFYTQYDFQTQAAHLKTGLDGLIKLGHELNSLSMERDENHPIRLQFKNKNLSSDGIYTVKAKHVILAIPKYPLEKLNLPDVFNGDLKNNRERLGKTLASVECLSLLKCFFVLENPWWEDNRQLNRYASDIPTRELSYHKSNDKTKGIIMIYTDRPSITYWSDYLREEGQPAIATQEHYVHWDKYKAKNNRLWQRFVQFARDYEHDDFSPERLLACGMRDWGKKPFAAAAHGWLPGEKSWEHIKYLSAFPTDTNGDSLPGYWKGRIHVCGEAYSDYQGFIEGSLRSASLTIKKIK